MPFVTVAPGKDWFAGRRPADSISLTTFYCTIHPTRMSFINDPAIQSEGAFDFSLIGEREDK